MALIYYIPDMPTTLETVSQDALILPPDQRVELAYRLLVSVEPETQNHVEAAWDAEIAERMTVFDAGELQGIPAADVFNRLRVIAP